MTDSTPASQTTGGPAHDTLPLIESAMAASSATDALDGQPATPVRASTYPATAVQPFAPATSRMLRGRRLQLLVAAVIVLLGLGGWQTWLAHTRGTALAHTRHTLATTRTDLAATKTALKASRSEVASDNKQIGSLHDKLTKLNGNLDDARTQLKGAQNTVDLQGREIGNLRSCLSGVSAALSDLANGYGYTALADLQAVTGSCQAANNGLAG